MKGFIINYDAELPERTDEHLHTAFSRCIMNYRDDAANNESHTFDKYTLTFSKLAHACGMPFNKYWERVRAIGRMGIPAIRGPIHIYVPEGDVGINILHLIKAAQLYFQPDPVPDSIVIQ